MAKKSFGTNEPCNIDYEITDEGAYRLATAVIEVTYYDYKSALKKQKKWKAKWEALKPDFENYQKWVALRINYNRYKNKIYKTEEQRQMINEFLSTPEPRKPTPNEKLFVNKWIENERTIADCELFYLSEDYKRLTLGQGLNGKEVIERIKKDVSTKRHYKKALV